MKVSALDKSPRRGLFFLYFWSIMYVAFEKRVYKMSKKNTNEKINRKKEQFSNGDFFDCDSCVSSAIYINFIDFI